MAHVRVDRPSSAPVGASDCPHLCIRLWVHHTWERPRERLTEITSEVWLSARPLAAFQDQIAKTMLHKNTNITTKVHRYTGTRFKFESRLHLTASVARIRRRLVLVIITNMQ